MPKRCAAFHCRGNYDGEPYTPVVRFPADPSEKELWIEVMPNNSESLRNRKELYICASHFDCKWVKAQGGKRPINQPTIFEDVAKSCLKQTTSSARRSNNALSSFREKYQKKLEEEMDKIGTFQKSVNEVGNRFKGFNVFHNGADLTLSMTDNFGRNVKQFIYFREVQSPFGFLFLERVKKDGFEIPKKTFHLQTNSLLTTLTDTGYTMDTSKMISTDLLSQRATNQMTNVRRYTTIKTKKKEC